MFVISPSLLLEKSKASISVLVVLLVLMLLEILVTTVGTGQAIKS